ncbi:hypothetical protein [Nocardioides mesophilus]|uniref:Uncharacterized protein n=1 Tax=Nocardioides mesophilus TaxID=433659 RepID=A0A7G9RCI6_9ACTN|nr:hypothetical protein [Nocardioides mesophilus]QNN53311.1 hypothetical protein H9L09_02200 [Nocardioides mesophilus]
MRLFARGPVVPDEVLRRAGLPSGEKVLAACPTRDASWLLGTRTAFVAVPAEGEPTRIPWERVESADWSREDERLRVNEVGDFGHLRPVHIFTVDEPATLLPFVRERVTATVVLQRRVTVRGRQGLTVIGRRTPDGGEITWAYQLDPGLDPDDPEVRRLAEAGLRAAAEELGLS